LYRKYFSLVDVADGYWYASAEAHRVENWSGKLVLAMLKFFINNTWVLYSTHKAMKLDIYRRQLANILAKWDCKY